MTTKQHRILWPSLLMLALGLTAFAFASARKARISKTAHPNQNPAASKTGNGRRYVRMAGLWPQLRSNLKALGDRLEKPGKERLTLTGILSREGQSLPVLLVLEFPDRLRLEMQRGVQRSVVTFDGKRAKKAGGALEQFEADLVESLVYDSAEHFFIGQGNGMATRFLGSRFRTDDGTQPNYTGPSYDIYQTNEQLKHGAITREQTKSYCFNSRTMLLARVAYRNQISQAPIEIGITGWQEVQGQQVPTRIDRIEAGRPTLTLVISSASLGPALTDGIFDQ
jgi:hypothetical protein